MYSIRREKKIAASVVRVPVWGMVFWILVAATKVCRGSFALRWHNETCVFLFVGVWGFISSPHFFQADEKFRRDVHGMKPDSDKHEFVMSFDPVCTRAETVGPSNERCSFLSVNECSIWCQRAIATQFLHAEHTQDQVSVMSPWGKERTVKYWDVREGVPLLHHLRVVVDSFTDDELRLI